MKQTTLLLFVLLSWAGSYSQRCDWVDYAAVNNLSSTSNAIATDASGNIFVLNTFTVSAIIQGDTIQAQYGNVDCIMVKYDSSGNYQWAKVFGSASADDIFKIAVDASGHVYASCFTQGNTMMSDTTYTNVSGYQVIQFDNDGNFLRVKFIAGLGVAALASLGNYVYAAYTNTVEKLDTNLNSVWSQSATAGSLTFYSKGDLYVTPNGHLIASGSEATGGAVTFDTISFNFSGGGFDEVFVISMDTSGNAYWGRAFYGLSTQAETTFGAAGDDAGNVYLTLQTSAQMIFANDTLVNPLLNPNNNYTAVLRYDNAGNAIWGRALYPTGSSDFYDVMVNNLNEVLIAGDYMNGSAVFEQYNFPASGAAFVIKIDVNGNAVWEKRDLNPNSFTKHFKGLARLSPGKYAAVGFYPANFRLDCFNAGPTNTGFFTTVISENLPANASFTVTPIDPFTFSFNDLSAGTIVSWSWSFPGGTPATSTLQSPTVTYTVPGSYTATLIVCDGICCDTATQQILNVGMDELTEDADLAVYPNPVSSELEVRSSETINEIKILDVLGNEIYKEQNLKTSNVKHPTSNLAPGIYFLKVTTKGKLLIRKFVKE